MFTNNMQLITDEKRPWIAKAVQMKSFKVYDFWVSFHENRMHKSKQQTKICLPCENDERKKELLAVMNKKWTARAF